MLKLTDVQLSLLQLVKLLATVFFLLISLYNSSLNLYNTKHIRTLEDLHNKFLWGLEL